MRHNALLIPCILCLLSLGMSGCGENDDIQHEACVYDEQPLSWKAAMSDTLPNHKDFESYAQWVDHFEGSYAVEANGQTGSMKIARGEDTPLERRASREQYWCSNELIVPVHVTLVQNDTEWSHTLTYDLAQADAGGSHPFRDLEDTAALTAYAPRPNLDKNQRIHAVFAALTLVPFKDITLTFHSGIETEYNNGDIAEFRTPWFELSTPIVDE